MGLLEDWKQDLADRLGWPRMLKQKAPAVGPTGRMEAAPHAIAAIKSIKAVLDIPNSLYNLVGGACHKKSLQPNCLHMFWAPYQGVLKVTSFPAQVDLHAFFAANKTIGS